MFVPVQDVGDSTPRSLVSTFVSAISHFSTIAEKAGGITHAQEEDKKEEVAPPRRPSRPSITSASSALEHDKATTLSCWLAMGGEEDTLINGAGEDVSGWKGVDVVEGRYGPWLLREASTHNVLTHPCRFSRSSQGDGALLGRGRVVVEHPP